jgi:hypothetical protein
MKILNINTHFFTTTKKSNLSFILTDLKIYLNVIYAN